MARKRRQPSRPAMPGDLTPERKVKAGTCVEPVNFDIDGADHHKTIRVFDDYPIERLFRTGRITPEQHADANRFHEDWHTAGLAHSCVVDLSRPVVDTSIKADASVRQVDALARYRKAVIALGAVHCQVLSAVVLSGVRLEDYGRSKRGYSGQKEASTAALEALRNALEQLGLHYGNRRGGVVASISVMSRRIAAS